VEREGRDFMYRVKSTKPMINTPKKEIQRR